MDFEQFVNVCKKSGYAPGSIAIAYANGRAKFDEADLAEVHRISVQQRDARNRCYQERFAGIDKHGGRTTKRCMPSDMDDDAGEDDGGGCDVPTSQWFGCDLGLLLGEEWQLRRSFGFSKRKRKRGATNMILAEEMEKLTFQVGEKIWVEAESVHVKKSPGERIQWFGGTVVSCDPAHFTIQCEKYRLSFQKADIHAGFINISSVPPVGKTQRSRRKESMVG